MTTIPIDRELLEQVASEFEHDNDRYMLGRELRKVLDAPRQPEGEGLTRYGLGIVGGIAAFVSANDGCMVLHDDAKRAIAELRDECERLRKLNETRGKVLSKTDAERDTLRQQLAERDAQLLAIASAEPRRHTIEWAKAMAATGNNEAYVKWREAFDQRDRLAELLRQARLKMAYMLKHGEWHSPERLIERIDAALAEVK